MPTQREEFGGTEDPPQDEAEALEDIDEDDLEKEAPPPVEDEEGSGATSLDELLAERAAARRGSDDADDDDDIMALASERTERFYESATARVIPIKDRQEFVCSRCHLVKAKSQLADPQRGLCRDCV